MAGLDPNVAILKITNMVTETQAREEIMRFAKNKSRF